VYLRFSKRKYTFFILAVFSQIVVFAYEFCPLISATGTRLLGEEWEPPGKVEAAWSAREENRKIS
jgi:hypothetical protein